jgi:hypothetical protein
MSVADARDYYSDALGEQGWEESPSRVVPGAPMAGLHATKAGGTLMATITAIGDTTQINLNVHDRQPRRVSSARPTLAGGGST